MNKDINAIRDLMTWIRINVGKSVNFSVEHWSYKADGSETTEYKLWVDGLINKSTESLADLINLIPTIKQYCELNRELAA